VAVIAGGGVKVNRRESQVPKMIVSSQQVQNAIKVQRHSQPKRKVSRIDSGLKPDKLELSNHAQELRRTTDLVLKSPDVRADKIDKLKKQIQAGGYHRTGAEIASKMVDRSLVDEFAGR
jgi:flagellar biosynthesis anti-sigma factor FlgM